MTVMVTAMPGSIASAENWTRCPDYLRISEDARNLR
jgi:hypothetical protein